MAPAKATKKNTTNPSKSTAKTVSPRTKRVSTKNKRTHPFPFKMRDVLNGNNKHIIDWKEGGKVFIIKDHRAFEDEILPQYGFETRELRSFSRNLSAWGFHRYNRDPKINVGSPGGTEWKNKHFYEGVTDSVLKLIKRKESKKKACKSTGFLSRLSDEDEMDLANDEESIEQPVDSTEEDEDEDEEEEEDDEDEDDHDDDEEEEDIPLEATLQREDSLFAEQSQEMFAIHQSDELPVKESKVDQPTRPTRPSFMRRHLDNL